MRKQNITEQLSYRKAMRVREIVVLYDDNAYPVCPRCCCSFETEYQSFCDRCGQKLNWRGFEKAKCVKML